MSYDFRDHYFLKAKKENYLARAIYKLEEIQKKHKILRSGDRVLDLGAAPGSWIQLTSGVVGPGGLVVGVDLKAIEHPFPKHVVTMQRDIYEESFIEDLLRDYGAFDVVLSDMAPSTSGFKVADCARSELLYERAFELARRLLKPQGHFLAKIFQGSDFHKLLQETKKYFGQVKVVKPDASKKQSKEIYILAMRFKKP
ncbi:MAG: SAM-dependent methyltransferase [Acidobacteriota bacterium]